MNNRQVSTLLDNILELLDVVPQQEIEESFSRIADIRMQGISEIYIPIFNTFARISNYMKHLFLTMLQICQSIISLRQITPYHTLCNIQQSLGGLYLNDFYVGSCFVLHDRYVVTSYNLLDLANTTKLSVKFNSWRQLNNIPIIDNSSAAKVPTYYWKVYGNCFHIIPSPPEYGLLELKGDSVIPPGLYNQSAEIPQEGGCCIVNEGGEATPCFIIPHHYRGLTFDSILQRANSNPQCDYMKCGDIDSDWKCIHKFTKERFTSPNDTDISTYMISNSVNNMLLPVANMECQVFAMHVLDCPYTKPGSEPNYIGKALILSSLVKDLQANKIDILNDIIIDNEPML